MRWFAALSTRFAAAAYEAQSDGVKLNLGCGRFPLPGWFNTDLRPRSGIYYLDARRHLPFKNQAVDYIYSEHFLEHLHLDEGRHLLKECRRVLRPGGVLRISTPDLQKLIQTYLDTNPQVSRQEALRRHQGIIPHPIRSPALFFNDKMRQWGHQHIYDQELLEWVLEEAGFDQVEVCRWGQSSHESLRNLEHHADVEWMKFAEVIIVEAH